MKGNALYVSVGVLVLAGAALAVAFVLFLAGTQGPRATTTFETYSRESVQGLDVGAPVRYRGVQIGRVTQLDLVSAQYARTEDMPFSEFFQLVVIRFVLDTERVGEVPRVDEALQLGLRARITSQGLTGVSYLELDFVNADRFPVPRLPWTPRFPVIPSIPSTVEQVRTAAETLVQRLSDAPVEDILNNMNELLATLRQQAQTGDAAATLRDAARSAELLRETLERGEIDATLAELRGAAQAARELIGGEELRSAVASTAAAAAELRRAAQALPGTLQGFDRTLRTARDATLDMQGELAPILANLRATTASLRATAEALRNSPSQALFGAPPPPPERRR